MGIPRSRTIGIMLNISFIGLASWFNCCVSFQYSSNRMPLFLPLMPIINNSLFPPGLEQPSVYSWWISQGFTQVHHFLSTGSFLMWASRHTRPYIQSSSEFFNFSTGYYPFTAPQHTLSAKQTTNMSASTPQGCRALFRLFLLLLTIKCPPPPFLT